MFLVNSLKLAACSVSLVAVMFSNQDEIDIQGEIDIVITVFGHSLLLESKACDKIESNRNNSLFRIIFHIHFFQ